jgi:hypothetical protein
MMCAAPACRPSASECLAFPVLAQHLSRSAHGDARTHGLDLADARVSAGSSQRPDRCGEHAGLRKSGRAGADLKTEGVGRSGLEASVVEEEVCFRDKAC